MHAFRTPTCTLFIASLALVASGCRAYPPGVPLPDVVDEINATLQPNVFVLQPGDGVNVQFRDNPGKNQNVLVRPDGRAVFYLLDELEVEGMTVDELDQELTRRYEESLISPEVEVAIGKLSLREVLILGKEGKKIPLNPRINLDLIEAYAKAGIPRKPTSMLQHTVLMRYMPEEGRRRYWTIDTRSEYWQHPVPLMLQNRDILYIPDQPLETAATWMRTFMRMLPLPRFLLAQG